MTLNSVPIDIYFHMANHYKKLQNVKSVIDTSSPKGYEKSQGGRRSRPHSRIDSCSSAKSRTSNSSDRFYNIVSKLGQNTNCSSARSHSLPIRPITRRKSSNMPNSNQNCIAKRGPSPKSINYECFITDSTKTDSDKVTIDVNYSNNGICKRPTPAPRTKSAKKDSINKKRTVEHDYLKFSLRIMEDIIRNNLHTNEQMRNIFKSHLQANSGHLDNDKMIEQINYLQLELNIPNESDDENDSAKIIPPVKYTQCSSTLMLSPDLKCECKVVRRLPLVSENALIINNKVEKSKNSKPFNIEQLFQEENEIFLTVPPQDENIENKLLMQYQSLSPCLSSVIEKSEPTSSIENFKEANKNSDSDSKSHDKILDDIEVMVVTHSQSNALEDILIEDEICSVLKNIEKKTGTLKNSILVNASEDASKQSLSPIVKPSSGNYVTNQNVINENELNTNNNRCEEKTLVFTKSENIHIQCSGNINDNYVLISGPIFIPKTYLNGLSTEESVGVSIPSVSDKDRLLITKDASVNTDLQKEKVKQESVAIQCIESSVNTTDKCLNTSITGISMLESSFLKKASDNCKLKETVHGVDLDCYDLTPERDNNYKHINSELLLGDEYAIQQDYKVFDVSPQVISEFYPDDATQTRSSDWSLIIKDGAQKNDSSNKEPITDSLLKVILPSHSLVSVGSNTFSKILKEDVFDDNLYATSDINYQLRAKENSRQKSNLKYYLNASTESLTTEDEAEDKFKKRQSVKGVSINIDSVKNKTTDSPISGLVLDEVQTNKNYSVDVETISQCSSDTDEEHQGLDDTNKLDSLDIMTSLPELVPQSSVLMTVKRVTKTWDKLRSKRSIDKSTDSTRAYSFVDEIFSNANTSKYNTPNFNSNNESKEKNVKKIETELSESPEQSVSQKTFCCGLKKKILCHELTAAERSDQIIPIISTVDTNSSKVDNSMFNQELSTSTTSLQKGVHYNSQPIFINDEEENENDDYTLDNLVNNLR